jgi:hypothetical protein
MAEQRYRAVLAVIAEGKTVTEAAGSPVSFADCDGPALFGRWSQAASWPLLYGYGVAR